MKKVWRTILFNIIKFDVTDIVRTSDYYEGEVDGGGNGGGNSDWEGELDWG